MKNIYGMSENELRDNLLDAMMCVLRVEQRVDELQEQIDKQNEKAGKDFIEIAELQTQVTELERELDKYRVCAAACNKNETAEAANG
ncbi:MAG: hypothetical protein ACLU8W_10040 [Clostridia bacterium]